jgi:ABC-2 type transport system ATP-binding protein
MDEAEALCDLVHIVNAGRLVASGSPAELTQGQVGALSFRARPGLPLAELLPTLPAGCTAVEAQPGLYRVDGAVGPTALAGVTAWCARHDVMPEILHSGRRTLEDVFLELTGRGDRP